MEQDKAMNECIYKTHEGYCILHSDGIVREYCVEGPCDEVCQIQEGKGCTDCPIAKAFNRLAAIEDILGNEYELDRLRELAQADREGKFPKYTIGDTIYDRFGNAWEVRTAELHLLDEKPDWMYRCGHAGTDDYCALWSFEILPRADAEAALRGEQDNG